MHANVYSSVREWRCERAEAEGEAEEVAVVRVLLGWQIRSEGGAEGVRSRSGFALQELPGRAWSGTGCAVRMRKTIF